MNKPIDQFTDQELLVVIRRAENTNIPGSLYQKANKEWQIRHQQKLLDATKDVHQSVLINVPKIETSDLIVGDKISHDKDLSQGSNFLAKYWWGFIIPIVVIVIGFIFTEGRIPALFKTPTAAILTYSEKTDEVATSTLNISDILSRKDDYRTSLDKQNFLEKYKDSIVDGAGSFNDINKSFDTYYLFMYVGKNAVACAFNNPDTQIQKKLQLLKDGDKVSFSGIFSATTLNGSIAWYVRHCILK